MTTITRIVCPIVMIYDALEDPRPDLAQDSAVWVSCFRVANTGDRKLLRLLHLLRSYGARIARLPREGGGERLELKWAPILQDPDFAGVDVKKDWLKPNQSAIAACFKAVEGRVA